ncbi:conserved domain protein [Ruminococcus albus 8]|uniref:Conserved domain protein n=1 Tax=Ruminococcus albus 8 TaxID=246199 RepID=E9S7Q8_RUMAL|nr:conserved domain protein [Ruminococcus albus 8]
MAQCTRLFHTIFACFSGQTIEKFTKMVYNEFIIHNYWHERENAVPPNKVK